MRCRCGGDGGEGERVGGEEWEWARKEVEGLFVGKGAE